MDHNLSVWPKTATGHGFLNDYLTEPDLVVKGEIQPFQCCSQAIDVTSEHLARYVDKRQQEEAANATINRELAALKRMLHLGQQATPPKVIRALSFLAPPSLVGATIA